MKNLKVQKNLRELKKSRKWIAQHENHRQCDISANWKLMFDDCDVDRTCCYFFFFYRTRLHPSTALYEHFASSTKILTMNLIPFHNNVSTPVRNIDRHTHFVFCYGFECSMNEIRYDNSKKKEHREEV